MIDKALLTVLSGVLLLALGVHLLLLGLPLFRRIEFDAVCHRYALIMDQSGGLSGTAAGQLVQDLEARNFTVLQATGSAQATYGAEMTLTVRVVSPGYRMQSSLILEAVEWPFTYQTSLVCRVIKDFAAAP